MKRMELHLLNKPTLVLNKSWVAINTTTVRNAICLAYTGSARIVDPETYSVYCFKSWVDYSQTITEKDRCLRTSTKQFAVPEVVVLANYNKIPFTRVPFTRNNLYNRDDYRCQYCDSKPGTHRLTIDHVIPRSKGGVTSWENCVTACGDCNRVKGDRTPRQSDFNLKKKPVEPQWSPFAHVRKKDISKDWYRFIKHSVVLNS